MLELAALIAAIAFAVLVVFVCWNLFQVLPILKEVRKTLEQTRETVSVLTTDADHLLVEVEGVVNKVKTTLDDVNHKLAETDPMFTAIGNVGTSITDVNQSTKNMIAKLSPKRRSGQSSTLRTFGQVARSAVKRDPKATNTGNPTVGQTTIKKFD